MADQPYPPRSGARRWIVVGVVGALLIGAGGWLGFQILDDKDAQRARELDEQRHWCVGLDAIARPGEFELSKTDDGQCVGWTLGRDHTFNSTDPRVASVVQRIVEENNRVRDHAENYVRVGVLLPMTYASSSSALLADTIVHSLQGAYAAQRQANSGVSPLGDPALQIQLVLANEGADQRNWKQVVPELGRLRDGPHPLVAVTGMGISIPATTDAAKALHEHGIPVIGSVLTADDMVAPGLFKVSPSNHQYAQALQAFLTAQAEQSKQLSGYLVYDRNPDDNYVQSLYTAFMDTFGASLSLADRSRGFNGTLTGPNTLFEPHVNDICGLQPDVIFYAGRDRDLQALIDALRNRTRCTNGAVKPLLIATGSTGLNLADASALEDAHVGILDASATDPQSWQAPGPDTPEFYAAFHTLFTGTDGQGLGFSEDDLGDGYAIMQRDAVAAAIRAARWDFSAKVDAIGAPTPGRPTISPSPIPTAADVRNALYSISSDPLPGASGSFYFREKPTNDLWPIGKPVPIIRLGSEATTLPPVPTFRTRCQIRKYPDKPGNYETEDCST